MDIKQISIFIENKEGRLAEVVGVLSKANINIRSLSLADASDFGVLRLIVNDPDRCLDVLKENGFVAQQTEVIAVEIEDRPGGLSAVLDVFHAEKVNVEYMYAFVEKNKNNAIVIFKIDEPQRAKQILADNNIPIVGSDVIQ